MGDRKVELVSTFDTSGVQEGADAAADAIKKMDKSVKSTRFDTTHVDKYNKKLDQLAKQAKKPIKITVDEKGLAKADAQLKRMLKNLELDKAMEGKGAHWKAFEKARLDFEGKGRGEEFARKFAPAKAALQAKDAQDQIRAAAAKAKADQDKPDKEGKAAGGTGIARKVGRIGREVAGAAGAQFGPLTAIATMGPQLAIPIAAITYLGSKALPAAKFAWEDLTHTTTRWGWTLHDVDRALTKLFDRRSEGALGRMKDDLAHIDSEMELLRDRGMEGGAAFAAWSAERFPLAKALAHKEMKREREMNAPAATAQQEIQTVLLEQENLQTRIILAKRKSNIETQHELELFKQRQALAFAKVAPGAIADAERALKEKQQTEVGQTALQGINTLKEEDEIRSKLLAKGQAGNEYARELLLIEQQANKARKAGGIIASKLVDEQEEAARKAAKERREERFQAEKKQVELGQSMPGLSGRMLELRQRVETGNLSKDQAADLMKLEKKQQRIERRGEALQRVQGLGESTFEETRSPQERLHQEMVQLQVAKGTGAISGNTYNRALAKKAIESSQQGTDVSAKEAGSVEAYSTYAKQANQDQNLMSDLVRIQEQALAAQMESNRLIAALAAQKQNMVQAGQLQPNAQGGFFAGVLAQ